MILFKIYLDAKSNIYNLLLFYFVYFIVTSCCTCTCMSADYTKVD